MSLTPTLYTCTISHKPIRQKHIDKGLVTDWENGKAFTKSIQDTIGNPPENPVVFGANEISAITLSFAEFNFPKRVVIKGRTYKKLPQYIYVQNQRFKLLRQVPTEEMPLIGYGETQDGCTFKGAAFYKKVITKVVKEEVDK
jgi:hypothetical protein